MKLAYSYIRFSSIEQSKGDSLRRQLSLTESYCQRHGLTLDQTLTLRDLGKSAFKGANVATGALGAFLDAIKSGKVKPGAYLIVESLDRLSRQDVDDAYETFRSIIKAGVTIVTLNPEREHDRQSIKNILGLIEPLLIMSRGNEESHIKSARIGAAWSRKRATIGDKKLTAKIPAWLKLSKDKKTFTVIEDKAEIVRRIFALKAGGAGLGVIPKILNGERVPSIARVTHWQRSYVQKILTNRAVLGEFQAHELTTTATGKKRVPSGDVIANYYPPIVTEQEFYAAQSSLAVGKRQRGRNASVKNLFVGIAFDSHDAKPMNLVDKGRKKSAGPRLVSAGAIRGSAGSVYRSVNYESFESAILSVFVRMKATDDEPNVDELTGLEAKLDSIKGRITKLQEALAGDGELDVIIPAIKSLQGQRLATESQIDKCKQEASRNVGDDLRAMRAAQSLLDESTDENRAEVRTRIKSVVARVFERINVTVLDRQTSISELRFKTGFVFWVGLRDVHMYLGETRTQVEKMM